MVYLLALILNIAYATDCDLKNEPHLNTISNDSTSIMRIVNGQRVAYQDGPNCYNAALFGKGYVSELTFVDNTEFTFYIKKFCSPNSQTEEPGDIITVKYQDGSYEHAALVVQKGLIFEKDSTWGKNPPRSSFQIKSQESPEDKARVIAERADSSLYKIKNINQSSYFGNPKYKDQGAQFQAYKCRETKNINADLVNLSLILGVKEILNINKKIENLVFSEKPEESWQEMLAADLSVAADAATKSPASDDDGLFLFIKIVSLEGQLHHLTGAGIAPDQSSSVKFNEAFRKLKKTREILEEKQRQNKSELAKAVIQAL